MARSVHFVLRCLATAAALLVTAPAAAQFAALDRMDHGHLIGLQTDFTHEGGSEDMLPRTEIYGTFQFDPHLGFYAQFPFVHMLPAKGESESAMGNLEMGGFFNANLGGAGVVVRLGVGLPTSKLEGGNAQALQRNAWPRLTDYALQLPETTTIRASVSPTASAGAFFFRADVGTDILLDQGERDSQLLLRANVGVGVRIKGVALTGEFVNLGNAQELADDAFAHAISVSVRHGVLYTGVTTPIDEDRVIWAWTVGLSTEIADDRNSRRRRVRGR